MFRYIRFAPNIKMTAASVSRNISDVYVWRTSRARHGDVAPPCPMPWPLLLQAQGTEEATTHLERPFDTSTWEGAPGGPAPLGVCGVLGRWFEGPTILPTSSLSPSLPPLL